MKIISLQKKCYYLLHLYYKLLYYHRSTLGQFSSARVTNFQKLFFLLENANFNRITRCTKINSANFCSNLTKKIHFPFSCMEKFASSLFLKKKYCWKVFGTKKFVAQPMVFMHCLFVIEKCVELEGENFQNIN
jgi:hypothetical protein